MNRRAFIASLALGLASACPLATAQQRVWRIGYLTPADIPGEMLVAALSELGYVDARTARVEVRSAQNDFERLPELAADLVRARVDVIVAVSPPAIVVARRATTTIPIVMAFWGGEGLIESGVVASFSRPGGNVTGVYMLADELDVKRLELLLEAVPKARTVAMLNPGAGWPMGKLTEDMRQIVESHGARFIVSDVLDQGGYVAAFAAMSRARGEAVIVPSFPRFYREHLSIIEAAATHRIPAMYEWGEIARDGGLIAYGPVIADLNRRVAIYVDKILKGAKPGDLPVEQPSKFELVINLKTMKALDLTIPEALMLRADELIR
jgi:putative ABC transport system substrate-binding protein